MRNRKPRGSAVAEIPVVLWLIILAFLFPMINYATVAIRSGFVFNAAGQAALQASKARSYSAGTATVPSATTLALQTAQNNCASWTGVHLVSVVTNIVTTKLSNQAQSRQSGFLQTPPDTASNTYQIEVTLNCNVDPLITVNFPMFANLAGISGPFPLSVTQRNYVENSQGLMR